MAKIRGPYSGEYTKARFREAERSGYGHGVTGGRGRVSVSWSLKTGKRLDLEMSVSEAADLIDLLTDLFNKATDMESEGEGSYRIFVKCLDF